MKKTVVALSGAALLCGGLAVPQAAVADTGPTAVRNVKVSTSKGCVRVKWRIPSQDTGDTYGVIVRTPDWSTMRRVETYKTSAKICDLKSGKYTVLVKQYGGTWVRSVVKVARPR